MKDNFYFKLKNSLIAHQELLMAKNGFIVEVTFKFPETACYIVNGRCPLDSEYEYIQDKASHDFQC